MAYQTPLTIRETLEGIAQNRFVLPAIQREFVWAQEPERMTRLFDSILRGYPVGTFLFWRVTPEQSKDFHFYEFMREWHQRKHRHNDRLHLADPREITAILDGQQRLTTLNIGLYGSIAHKLPRKRFDSLDAYPPKTLHIDLLHAATDDDDYQYAFEFLTEEQAATAGSSHWYRVGDILDIEEPAEGILEYLLAHDLAVKDGTAFKTLFRLWKAVHEDGVVSYFEEREQSLTKVLDIFVRVNSGGVVLTKSDLLLSIATAQFEGRDAREEIHGLVDDINDTKPGFRFSKDLVLKAGLVLTGISDVGFKVESFTASNMKILDQQWDEVDRALRIGVKLLASFGFSESSLPAASVLIPVADYIHHRQLDDRYITSASREVRRDRELVRQWTIRTILKPGIWGSGLDVLLKSLHAVIRESRDGFPMDALETEMARRGKSLSFDDVLIDELVDTPYRHKRTFALLSLLYDWVDTRNDFHVDHVFPRSLATRTKLRDHGVPADEVDDVVDRIERLSNLQLLPGPENIQKRAQLPGDWIRSHIVDENARRAWLVGHDLHDLPADLVDFIPFYEQRRSAMRHRLVQLLGLTSDEISAHADDSAPAPPLPDAEALPPAATVADHEIAAGTDRERAHHNIKVADLLSAGLISADDRLHGLHRKSSYEVQVVIDGRLQAGSEVYETPSQAARLLAGMAAVNGWVFWHTADGRSLAEVRNELR